MAASGGSGQRRLGVALYRALLRWGRANADVPFTLRSREVYALAPELRGTALALQDSAAVGPIARAAFEACRHANGEEQAAALDRGIEGVRLLNTVYAEQIKDMRETRWVPSAAHFSRVCVTSPAGQQDWRPSVQQEWRGMAARCTPPSPPVNQPALYPCAPSSQAGP